MQDTHSEAPAKPAPHPIDEAMLRERQQLQSDYNRESDAIDLKWLLATLYTGRHLIVGSVVLAALLAMAYVMTATPRYEAASQLLIESRRPKIMAGDEVAPGLDTGRYMISQVIDSQIELLRSPSLAERVIRDLDLREFQKRDSGWLSGFFGPEKTDAPKINPQMTISPVEKIERKISPNEINAFLRGLDVRRVGLSLIIQVKYFHKDPKQAARIANAVATRYLAIQQEKRFEKTETAREWLTERVRELQKTTGESRQRIEEYKAKHDLVETGGQPLQERELSESMAQLIAARANASTHLAEVKRMEEALAANSALEATSVALNSNVISDYKRQYAQVQRRLAQTVSSFGESHPQVDGFKAELKNIEREIRREVKRLIENLRNKHEIAKTKASLLTQRMDQLKAKLSDSRQLKIELAEMERSLKVDSDLYSTLLSRLRETELQRSLKQADAIIARYARAPQRPTRPRKALVMVGSVMAAVTLSVAYMLLTEFFGNYLRTPAAVRRYLGFRNIVALPYVKAPAGARSGSALSSRLLNSTGSLYVQQIFVLKELVNRRRPGDDPLVVAVISASKNEGKTTTASSLAQYVAESNQRTLLVDCDLHDAGASAGLPSEPEKYLQDIVGPEADRDISDTLAEATVRLPSGLEVLAARIYSNGPRPMDVLAGREIARLMDVAREKYDLVVLDTPALSEYVDARALAGLADLLLLVIESDKSTVSKVNEALDPIDQHRDKIAAVVFNKARSMRTERHA